MTVGMVAALRNARLDAITTFAGASCILRIYSGVRPATGGAITTVLAELVCNATFAPAASAGGADVERDRIGRLSQLDGHCDVGADLQD